MIARLCLAVAAMGVAVFLALELHSEQRLQAGKRQAFTAGERAIPPARRSRVFADLEAAQRLHPGTEAQLARALVLLRAGDGAAAERLARLAVEREPRNWEAWRTLGATLQGRDDPAARRAIRRARELNPRAP